MNHPVQPEANLVLDDLAKERIQRGVATSKAQALAVLTRFQEVVAEKVADGYAVNPPLFPIPTLAAGSAALRTTCAPRPCRS